MPGVKVVHMAAIYNMLWIILQIIRNVPNAVIYVSIINCKKVCYKANVFQ